MSKKLRMNSGQAMLLSVIFFLLISLTIILGITVPVINHIKLVAISNNSKQSYVLAEALNEDALYRLNHGKNLSSVLSLNLNGATAAATVTTVSGNKQIISQGIDNKITRAINTLFTQGVGIAFNYGVQVGQGGFAMSGSSRVVGNVYSNGDIGASGSITITGSAIAADSAALTADQTNNSPTTPPNSVTFANVSASQDLGQSFQVSTSSPLNKIQLYLKKISTPSDATVKIVADNAGSPGTTVLDSGTLSASQVTTSYSWVNVVFTSNYILLPNTTYWVVVDSSANASKYYIIGANASGYSNGLSKVGTLGGTWSNTSPSGLDSYFTLYLGGVTSLIGGTNYVGGITIGSGGVGDAWAYDVEGASVAGHNYCQIGSNNNKACDTSRPDPSPQPFPVSDGNIQDWKDEAVAGGVITGDYNLAGASSATIGPTKITGNLNIGGSGTLTIAGTIWVVGNVSISGAAQVRLSSSYGASSGVIVSDGWADLEGSGQFSGSGTVGSYPMIITTSACPYSGSCSGHDALVLSGAAGAVILNAQNGIMDFTGSASAKSAVALKMVASGSATITYDSGLANLNFSSGPSGSWNVNNWQEIP